MGRADHVEFEGKVVEALAGGTFRVQLETGHAVLAYLAGRLRRHRIRVVVGDNVTVALSPYDPNRGMITYRRQ